MRTELESRREIVDVIRNMWSRGHANTTGISVSERIYDDKIIVNQSGTGFNRCKLTVDDLLVIDINGNLKKDAPNGSKRRAPVNVVIHTDFYKANPMAMACVHCHPRYSIVFACEGVSLMPHTLQSQILGEVPCVMTDSRVLMKKFLTKKKSIVIPSGFHGRADVMYAMKKAAKKTVKVLKHRKNEMKKHGLAVLHYQHGVFVFGRNLGEAFDNLERTESNAHAQLFSKLLK